MPNFVLRSDLTFAENVVLNYALQTKDKALTIGSAMNFIHRSAAQKAFIELSKKYGIISSDDNGVITVHSKFEKNMIPYKLRNRIGRPLKIKE